MGKHSSDVPAGEGAGVRDWSDTTLGAALLATLWRWMDAGGMSGRRSYDCALLEAALDLLPVPPAFDDRPPGDALVAEADRRRIERQRFVPMTAPAATSSPPTAMPGRIALARIAREARYSFLPAGVRECWDEQPEEVREGWCRAAEAVAQVVMAARVDPHEAKAAFVSAVLAPIGEAPHGHADAPASGVQHHEYCDTLEVGPDLGPSTKPCNCAAWQGATPPPPAVDPEGRPSLAAQRVLLAGEPGRAPAVDVSVRDVRALLDIAEAALSAEAAGAFDDIEEARALAKALKAVRR